MFGEVPAGRVKYTETTKFILSFLYIGNVQRFYSVAIKRKSPLLMGGILLHFTKARKYFLNVLMGRISSDTN